jgi:predicted transposase YdaD
MEVTHREEVAAVAERVGQTWEQELIARGEARGEARGRMEMLRENLRLLLEERFGPVPAALAEQIAAIEDPERLRAALRQVVHLASLEDLRL